MARKKRVTKVELVQLKKVRPKVHDVSKRMLKRSGTK